MPPSAPFAQHFPSEKPVVPVHVQKGVCKTLLSLLIDLLRFIQSIEVDICLLETFIGEGMVRIAAHRRAGLFQILFQLSEFGVDRSQVCDCRIVSWIVLLPNFVSLCRLMQLSCHLLIVGAFYSQFLPLTNFVPQFVSLA